MDLNVSVSDGIAAASVGPGGPAKRPQTNDGGPKPREAVEQAKTFTSRLFEGIQLFARGPAVVFSAYPLTA